MSNDVHVLSDGVGALGKTQALLMQLLKDGPRSAGDIIAAAQADNVNERTMRRAADALGVVKSKAGFGDGWIWTMAPAAAATV